MSLLFGNLTQDFVTYATIVLKAKAGDPVARAGLPAASAAFRHSSALDAGYLSCIGKTTRQNKSQQC